MGCSTTLRIIWRKLRYHMLRESELFVTMIMYFLRMVLWLTKMGSSLAPSFICKNLLINKTHIVSLVISQFFYDYFHISCEYLIKSSKSISIIRKGRYGAWTPNRLNSLFDWKLICLCFLDLKSYLFFS